MHHPKLMIYNMDEWIKNDIRMQKIDNVFRYATV